MSRRPRPIAVGQHVRIRVHRGPRADGRWYWRADRGAGHGDARIVLWSGWGTPDEAERATIAALRETEGASPREVEQIRTVHDLLDCWVAAQEARRDIAAITARNAALAAARLSGTIGAVRLREVDRRVVERHRDRCGDSGATVARDLKYLRQAWRWGREVGACSGELPTVRVQRREPVRTRYTPGRQEVAALLEHVRRHSAGAYRGLVLLAATGARPGELLALRWGAVASDCTALDVAGKTGARRIQLHPSVAAELRGWTRGHPEARVVAAAGNTVRKRLSEAAEALGLPRVSPTSLRRYVVDALYRGGARIEAAAAQLGHSPATALATYRQVTAEDQRAAVVDLPQVGGADVVLLFRKLRRTE